MSKEQVLQLLKKTEAIKEGHFQLSSGLHSDTYFQCAKLLEQPKNAMFIAKELAALFSDEDADFIISPAVGGIIIGFAVAQQMDIPFLFTERDAGTMCFRRGFELPPKKRVIVVEDVITTGGSVLEVGKLVEDCNSEVVGIGTILQRAYVVSPYPVKAILRMETHAYQQRDCKLCQQGIPLASPGSRRLKKI